MTALLDQLRICCLRRLVIGLIALCLPLQGWSIAASRGAGLAHVHSGSAAGQSSAASADEPEPSHHHGSEHHHAHAEHHEHADDDESVIFIDDGGVDSGPAQAVAAQRTLADIDIPLASPRPAFTGGTATPLPEAAPARFRSHIGEPLERPPR